MDVDPATTTGDFPARNTRDFTIEDGAGDALLVFGHGRVIAGCLAPAGSWPERGAGLLGIAEIAAWAGVYTIDHIFVIDKG